MPSVAGRVASWTAVPRLSDGGPAALVGDCVEGGSPEKFSPHGPHETRHASIHVNSSLLPSEAAERLTPLDHFRATTKRLKIHPLEMLLLWVRSVHWVAG